MKALLFFLCLLTAPLVAAQVVADPIPIHEAYLSKETPLLPLVSVASRPPTPKVESQPRQPNSSAIWVDGYWEWISELNRYEWICGIWRIPPPQRSWVPGVWKQQSDGAWVRFRGFWSDTPFDQLKYLTQKPPEPQDENTGKAPGNDYFWASGYWDLQGSQYQWLSGAWQPVDPNFVLTNANYLFRPEGIVFIAPYWDWPLDQRGEVYACDGGAALSTDQVIERIFVYYPDYRMVYWHFWHYHPHFWDGCGCAPPWWGWNDWWWIGWHHHWGLWWWWGHPGFAHPIWMEPWMGGWFLPPGFGFVGIFGNLPWPWFILANGVPGPGGWFLALGNQNLILPLKGAGMNELIDKLKEQMPKADQVIKPSGKPGMKAPDVPKWDVKTAPSGTIKLPGKPKPQLPPTIQLPPPPQVDIEVVPDNTYIPPPPPRREGVEIYIPPVRHWDHDNDDDYRRPHRRPHKPPRDRWPEQRPQKPPTHEKPQWPGRKPPSRHDDDDGDRGKGHYEPQKPDRGSRWDRGSWNKGGSSRGQSEINPGKGGRSGRGNDNDDD